MNRWMAQIIANAIHRLFYVGGNYEDKIPKIYGIYADLGVASRRTDNGHHLLYVPAGSIKTVRADGGYADKPRRAQRRSGQYRPNE